MSINHAQELTAAAFAAYYVTVDPLAGRLSKYDADTETNVALESDESDNVERAARLLSKGYIRPGYPWRAPVALVLEPRGGAGDCVLPRAALACSYPSREAPLGRLWAENHGGGVYAVLREGPRDRSQAPAPSLMAARLDIMSAKHRAGLNELRAARRGA